VRATAPGIATVTSHSRSPARRAGRRRLPRREGEGAADGWTVAVFGAPNGAARPVFDAKTRLPSRLVCLAPDRTTLAVTPSDGRPTGGLRLPFRAVTNAGTRIVDQRSFEKIVVNAPLGKSDFLP
jgi:hypothetical protein